MSLVTFCNLLPLYVFSIHRCFVGSVRGEHLWVFSSVFMEKSLTTGFCNTYLFPQTLSTYTAPCEKFQKQLWAVFKKQNQTKEISENKDSKLGEALKFSLISCKDFFRFSYPFPLISSIFDLSYFVLFRWAFRFYFLLLNLLTFFLKVVAFIFLFDLESCLSVCGTVLR